MHGAHPRVVNVLYGTYSKVDNVLHGAHSTVANVLYGAHSTVDNVLYGAHLRIVNDLFGTHSTFSNVVVAHYSIVLSITNNTNNMISAIKPNWLYPTVLFLRWHKREHCHINPIKLNRWNTLWTLFLNLFYDNIREMVLLLAHPRVVQLKHINNTFNIKFTVYTCLSIGRSLVHMQCNTRHLRCFKSRRCACTLRWADTYIVASLTITHWNVSNNNYDSMNTFRLVRIYRIHSFMLSQTFIKQPSPVNK